MAFKLKQLRAKAGRATERLTGPWAYLSLYTYIIISKTISSATIEGGLKKFIKHLKRWSCTVDFT